MEWSDAVLNCADRIQPDVIFIPDYAPDVRRNMFTNSYKDSMHYPDQEQLLKFTGLNTEYVHLEKGDPAEVISGYTEEINTDLVVIGTMHRKGAAALMPGNTSEKVLRQVKQDVLTLS